jgi:hypothetical protein
MGSLVVQADPTRAEILDHLESVLASPAFRNSQRSSEFLRLVVTRTVDGHPEMLKERQIGESVFGRKPDYDTGQDSIVRVKANEVRRRLAQYYDLNPGSPVRIELPSGSYLVQFHRAKQWPAVESPDTAPGPPHRFGNRTKLAMAAVSAAAVIAFALAATRSSSPFDQFWAPLTRGDGTVLISVPHPEVYRIYGADKSRLVEAFPPRPPGQPPRPLPEPAPNVTIFPEPNLYLGIGDARSLALIHSFLQGAGRQLSIRRANETGFTELRAGASVLLGGFTNKWTLEFTRTMPYTFRSQGPDWGIFEASTGQGICVKPKLWEPAVAMDCAVVARIMNSKSGKPVFIAAGLDHYGTFAVGEFLTRPELLNPALASAPDGWPDRNLEIVIQVEVVGDNVGPPKVLAVNTW